MNTTMEEYAFQPLVRLETPNPFQSVERGLSQSKQSQREILEGPENHDKMYVQCDFKLKLPKFSRQPDMWEPFLVQMRFISRSYSWSDQQFWEQVIFSLEGEALKFVSNFHEYILDNTDELIEIFSHRFGQCSSPEIYGAKLYKLKKLETETIQQYSQLMSKAYPEV